MKFTTLEYIQLRDLSVRKTSGHIEPFSHEKVEHAIRIACRKREIPDSQITKIASAVQRRIETEAKEDEITSEAIGLIISEALLALDPVAFIRFMSVYRKFSKVSEFRDLISKIPEPEHGQEFCRLSPKPIPGRLF
jgi:transcriptional repressor NrdR